MLRAFSFFYDVIDGVVGGDPEQPRTERKSPFEPVQVFESFE